MPLTVPAGFRVLIVEDDYFIADDMRRTFEKAGAQVVGPVPTAGRALQVVAQTQGLDAAVLDVNLEQDGPVFPVADALQARGIPFVFATGYDGTDLPDRYALVKRFEKPCDARRVLRALLDAR